MLLEQIQFWKVELDLFLEYIAYFEEFDIMYYDFLKVMLLFLALALRGQSCNDEHCYMDTFPYLVFHFYGVGILKVVIKLDVCVF